MKQRSLLCQGCGGLITSQLRRRYCSDQCSRIKAPAVYRFICPDGRSYVGSCFDYRSRDRSLSRSNYRLREALERYPADVWKFEIVELLKTPCTGAKLRTREQYHIERLRTYDPRYGLNVFAAIWDGGPAHAFYRRWHNEHFEVGWVPRIAQRGDSPRQKRTAVA